MENKSFSRKDRLIRQQDHDTYREKEKHPEPTECQQCGAVFLNGRWTWKAAVDNPARTMCPACRRIADNYPAGEIVLKGEFFRQHQQDVLNLVRNTEKQEKEKHPLERIMAINENDTATVVTTTGIHVARRIGEAVAHAFKGQYSFRYGDGEKSIMVKWER